MYREWVSRVIDDDAGYKKYCGDNRDAHNICLKTIYPTSKIWKFTWNHLTGDFNYNGHSDELAPSEPEQQTVGTQPYQSKHNTHKYYASK